jgi:hypothetical protein
VAPVYVLVESAGWRKSRMLMIARRRTSAFPVIVYFIHLVEAKNGFYRESFNSTPRRCADYLLLMER